VPKKEITFEATGVIISPKGWWHWPLTTYA
jgi:hypothetical protein